MYSYLSSVNNKPINILITDFTQCFDGLSLPLVCHDLYKSGLRDEKLALLCDINSKNKVAVKTSVGMTERVTFKENVMQGDPWGPVMASNQIDNLGKNLAICEDIAIRSKLSPN